MRTAATLATIALVALVASSPAAASFENPSAAERPKFTWWWPGVAVEDGELRAEIKEMRDAGFGGAQTFETTGLGQPETGTPPERFAWGTPFWADRIRTVVDAARANDFRIDLQVSSGWPWTSPAVSGKHRNLSLQQFVLGATKVAGGSNYVARAPRAPGVDRADARLIAVTAARVKGKRGRTTLLVTRSARDLTSKVDARGRLHWRVPRGRWMLFGAWQATVGQRSNDATRDEDPYVLDFLRRKSTVAATRYLDRHLLKPLGQAANGVVDQFHEDSLELQPIGLLWTGAFLKQFRARRGYDPTRYLPALSVGGWHSDVEAETGPRYDFPNSAGERVRRDYNETLTDLWIDQHVRPARAWAHRNGFDFQGRGHGLTMDVLAVDRAYDATDVDHIFNGNIDFFRTVTSAGRLSGADKASYEVGDMLNEDYTITPWTLKRLADKGLVGGANEIALHGYPYKYATGAGWPSWWPWSSEHGIIGPIIGVGEGFTPALPLWRHLPPFADYLARAHTVVRAGQAVSDVAIYRDAYGFFDESKDDGATVGLSLEPRLNTALARAGFGFDFVDPGTLAARTTKVRNRRLAVRGPAYKALVVDLEASKRVGVIDNSRAMAAGVARRLASFGRKGLPIVFVRRVPTRGVSYHNPRGEDRAVRRAIAQLRRSHRVRVVRRVADVPRALAALGVRANLSLSRPADVYAVHRQTRNGHYWFLWNGGLKPARFTGSFNAGRRAPVELDLWSGERRPLGLYRTAGKRIELPIELAPQESLTLAFEGRVGAHAVSTSADEVVVRDGKLLVRSTTGGRATVRLAGKRATSVELGDLPNPLRPESWALHVEGAVPQGVESHDLTLATLADWRKIPELRDTSGTGTYRATVTLGAEWAAPGRGAYLELGRVEGGVQVRVNDQLVHPASVPAQRLDVGRFLRTGVNTIEVELTTTLKNRLVELSKRDPAYGRFKNRAKTQPYGLLGPVRLVPYAELEVG